MDAFAKIPLVQLALMVAIVTAAAWILIPGRIALAISLVVTGILALRGLAEGEQRERGDDD